MNLRVRDLRTGAIASCPVGRRITIGREAPGSPADLRCNDPHVSRRHCELEALPDGRLCVLDVSTYGTWINQQRVVRQAWANAGDKLRLGHRYELVVEAESEIPGTRAAPPGFGSSSGALRAVPQPTVANAGSAATWSGTRGNGEIDLGPRYRVERKLGQGGMGAVYLATNERGQRVAVKVLKVVEMGPVAEVVERFKREAAVTKALQDHPGVVKVLDVGGLDEGKTLYYAMEYVEGESLERLIDQKVLQRPRAVWLVAQVAHAVAWAHARGVIHRDLKPANVLVSRAGTVHLTDFGVAKALGYGTITTTGAVIGTPNYMAPEQIEDSSRVGPLVDVYGLGGMLHAVLTGQPPYPGRGIAKVIRAVQRGEYDPPHKIDPTVPPELDTLCRESLARLPTLRPATAGTFAQRLEAWLETAATSVMPGLPRR